MNTYTQTKLKAVWWCSRRSWPLTWQELWECAWSYTKCVCVQPFISVTTGALGGWAGHSWPQGSPDYVYDSRAIIRAG